MTEPISNEGYYDYLKKRSTLGLLYRKYYLYPKLEREVSGLALDVGCGIGDFLKFRPNTVGVDINPKLVEYCRQQGLNAELMHPDALPFAANHFDSAVLDNVLEHVANPAPLLSEIWRVLKPNGRLLVGVPGSAGYKSDLDHKVFYDKPKLVETLCIANFALSASFYSPLESQLLSTTMRQYCLYATFSRAETAGI